MPTQRFLAASCNSPVCVTYQRPSIKKEGHLIGQTIYGVLFVPSERFALLLRVDPRVAEQVFGLIRNYYQVPSCTCLRWQPVSAIG